MGITSPGLEAQLCQITGGGTGTDAVTFASIQTMGETLKGMADATYMVFISGEFAAAQGSVVYSDLSSRTTTGFNLIGLGLNEVCNVLVIGRTINMPDPTAV